MKKLLLALLVTAPAMAVEFSSDYEASPDLNKKQASILAEVVRINGYRCDVIDAARRSPWDGSFTLHCNGFKYEYSIEDKGGRIVVTVE